MNEQETQESKALAFAAEVGHLMLENGAEISRVEETMERIATCFGVDSKDFFVLSNGIFTTGRSYAKVLFIPFKGTQLQKVVEANRLSRDVAAGKLSLDQAQERLEEIRNMKGEKPAIQILASAVGSGCFCAIFGGSLMDCAASFVIGMLLWAFVVLAGKKNISKIFSNIAGAAIVTVLCLLFCRLGFGHSLSHVLVGSLIPLVPGVPFTNGIKDLANEDYIAGTTRLLDALLVFFCIAMGVSLVLITYSHITGGMISL